MNFLAYKQKPSRTPNFKPYNEEELAEIEKKNEERKIVQDRINIIKNNRALEEQSRFDKFNEHASMNPPEYPILLDIKNKNNLKQEYYLTDITDNYIYAFSFEDAISKVKMELNNPNSKIQETNNRINPGSNLLRISSNNKGFNRTIINNLSLPEKDKFYEIDKTFLFWNIYVTNAPKSMFSSFRKSLQSKVQGGKKKYKSKSKKRKIKSKSKTKSKTKSKKNKLRR